MLNVSINPIWRNFLERGFFVFRWVKKKVWSCNFGDFQHDLKHNFNMISKSYVWTHFGKLLSGVFRELDVCFWGKLNLQIFRYIIFAKIFWNFIGAHPARVRLQASKIGRYFCQNRKSTLNLLFVIVAT